MKNHLHSLTTQKVHQLTKNCSQEILVRQSELVALLCEVIRRKAYLEYSNSLPGYIEKYLNVGRTTAYHYSQAAYLALDVPNLLEQIKTGEISICVASRVEKTFRDQLYAARDAAKPSPSLQKPLIPDEKSAAEKASADSAGEAESPAADSVDPAESPAADSAGQAENSAENSVTPDERPAPNPAVNPVPRPATPNLKPLTPQEKEEILGELAGKSRSEAERILASRGVGGAGTKKIPVARLVPQTQDLTRLELSLTSDELEVFNRVRSLMGHQERDLKRVFLRMADEWLDRHDPVRVEERAIERAAKRELKASAVVSEKLDATMSAKADTEVVDEKTGAAAKQKSKTDEKAESAPESTQPSLSSVFSPPMMDPKSQRAFTREQIPDKPSREPSASAAPNPSPSAPPNPSRKRRSISAQVRRKIMIRDQVCQYFLKTAQKCGATIGLDIDHVQPLAHGGADDPENLRVLCAAHNRNRHWMR